MTDTPKNKFDVLMDALDLSALPVEEQDELLLDLNTTIFKNALARMIEGMDDATRDAFAALMEREASEEELEAFFTEKVPGAEAAIKASIETMADDILAVSDPD